MSSELPLGSDSVHLQLIPPREPTMNNAEEMAGEILQDQQQESEHGLRDLHESVDSIHKEPRSVSIESVSILDKFPVEIFLEIFSYLSPRDLAQASQTCRTFAHHAFDDRLWANHVNTNLPIPITDPGLFPSFRRLYITHAPYWFIPKHKIWFADNEHTGNLILARYDNRRGVIEAYRVIADRGRPTLRLWTQNPEVIIQTFQPEVLLWLDDPVLLLKDHDPSSRLFLGEPWEGELRMPMQAEAHHVFSSLLLRRKQDTETVDPQALWPPSIIPTANRIVRYSLEQQTTPSSPSEIADFAFGIRRWAKPGLIVSPVREESVANYATLEPGIYTPTREKPYQGIWVGDYNAHGCEFLLFSQPDRDIADDNADAQSSLGQVIQDSDINRAALPGGSLQAIKLTGDPNVPRGELSFKADDIGPDGFIRIAQEEPFEGARVVRCLGHIAGRGFHDDSFIRAQLFLISNDYVALYWEELGHISCFKRVDIDDVLHT